MSIRIASAVVRRARSSGTIRRAKSVGPVDSSCAGISADVNGSIISALIKRSSLRTTAAARRMLSQVSPSIARAKYTRSGILLASARGDDPALILSLSKRFADRTAAIVLRTK